MADTETLSFEKVWQMFQETDKKFQETDKKFQETDKKFQETRLQMKETDRRLQETDRKISKLGSRIGDLVEELIVPNILEKFNKLGYVFGKVAPRVRYQDARGLYIAEVDLLLENGDAALAVEVKTQLTIADVRDHLERMEKLRLYADGHGDKRKFLGAVAGAIASKEVKAFAVKNGFFVLEQSGDTVQISVPEGFKPREW
ncbi:MAG: hypothetical protein LBF63_06710 [Treponema sp.]|jgi:hypothetical protein|nr:hypothetical protein [Treponema sp.]